MNDITDAKCQKEFSSHGSSFKNELRGGDIQNASAVKYQPLFLKKRGPWRLLGSPIKSKGKPKQSFRNSR